MRHRTERSFRDCWISQKSSLRPFLQCSAQQPRFPKVKILKSLSYSLHFHFLSLQFTFTLCSAALRQDSKKSVLILLLQLCFHHWGASLPKRFSKVSLIRGELKSGQCHQATVDFQFNVLNPSPSIMLRPPLRCLFHWEIQTLCCLSKMLLIEAVSFLLCVNLRANIRCQGGFDLRVNICQGTANPISPPSSEFLNIQCSERARWVFIERMNSAVSEWWMSSYKILTKW